MSTPRADANINLILDELVRLIGTIDGDPDLYLTSPATVKLWSNNPLGEATPAVFVRCKRWGPNEPQTSYVHNAQAEIEIECVCKFGDQVDNPDRELHRVISDVISVIERNWQLPGSGVPGLAIHVFDGYEPSAVLGSAAGYAAATCHFRAFWPWEAETP